MKNFGEKSPQKYQKFFYKKRNYFIKISHAIFEEYNKILLIGYSVITIIEMLLLYINLYWYEFVFSINFRNKIHQKLRLIFRVKKI